jgi:hypothetical protein
MRLNYTPKEKTEVLDVRFGSHFIWLPVQPSSADEGEVFFESKPINQQEELSL